MKPFEVTSNSWHYKLVHEHCVNVYGRYDLEESLPKNFCHYWRTVMFVLTMYTFAISLIVAALVLVAYVCYITLILFLMAPLATSAVVGTPIAAILTGIGLAKLVERRQVARLKQNMLGKPVASKGLFRTRYDAWKARVCPSVEYK